MYPFLEEEDIQAALAEADADIAAGRLSLDLGGSGAL
jgi:hypothetical protein